MEVYRKKMSREEYLELRRMIYLDKVACMEYDHDTQTCSAVLFADERAEKILQRAGFQEET